MVVSRSRNVDAARPVVMVDDDETDLDIGRRFFSFAELENPFVTLSSGELLLDHLKRVEQGDEPLPAAILLDVNMPRLDGFETLRKVRQRNMFRESPLIFMMTNSDNPRDIDQAFELGANGYQAKHFEIDEFVEFVRGLFR